MILRNYFIYIVAALCLLAGLANGIGDSLQFHYKTSFAAEYDAQFWNPKVSWENKWKKADGELVYPLQERFLGSSTFLVFTTDAWHLAKFFYHAFLRAAIALLMVLYLVPITEAFLKPWQKWAGGIVIYLLLAGIQAVGFHVFYTWL